jgi:hypothetical protein
MAALILGAAAALGAEPAPEPLLLWPNGAPNSNGLEGSETVEDCIDNISIPTITVYKAPAEKATSAAVVVMPGGAYGVVCVEVEGMGSHPDFSGLFYPVISMNLKSAVQTKIFNAEAGSSQRER